MNNSNNKAFSFDNPRNLRIYKLLGLVGSGPADFYRDACRLMSEENNYKSTSHLVTHLFREIESSIRWVIDPDVDIKDKDEGHKKSIIRCLDVLKISKDDPLTEAWLNLADDNSEFKLNKYAHRDGLKSPRPLDRDLKKHWNNVEIIFELILEKLESNYLKQIDRLDEIIEEDQPNKARIEELKQKIPNNFITRNYFFNNLKTKVWLKLLFEAGFFNNPPKKIKDKEIGEERYIPWPESQYLARIASDAPEDVKNIIQYMDDTDNPFVHGDLLDAMLNMPPVNAAELSDKAIKWIDESSVDWNTDKYGKLVKHFLSGGQIDRAIEFSRELFKLLPDKNYEKKGVFGPEPISLLDRFWFKDIIDGLLPLFIEKAELKALEMFSDLLEKGINLTKHKNEKGEEQLYFGSLRGIENFEQEEIHNKPIDILTYAVRSIAEELMKKYGIKVLNVLKKRDSVVFQRIKIHLRWNFPDVDREGTKKIISNSEFFDDFYVYHEFYHLLSECFGDMPTEVKEKYFEFISLKTRIKKGQSEKEKKDVRHDLFEFLFPIKDHLEGKWKNKFKNLSKEFKPRKYPDYHIYVCDAEWSAGFKTPKTREELASMQFDEMVEYLKEIKPTNEPYDYGTLEGYSIILKELSFNDPNLFASNILQYKGLRPALINGMLQGLKEAIRKENPFKSKYWSGVLTFFKWIVEQNRDEKQRWGHYENIDPGWGWTRNIATNILEDSLKLKKKTIPLGLRKKVWEVLLPLTDDPSPDEDEEKDSSFDHYTTAINTVRGTAIETVINYALWVKKKKRKKDVTFKDIPESRKILEKHLDIEYDSSLSIRSVYGRRFPSLVYLDISWAQVNKEKIFARDNKEYFDAAWNAYVRFNNPLKEVYYALKDHYAFAIQHIGEYIKEDNALTRADERLVDHLMAFYGHGEVDLETPIEFIPLFYKKANDSLRTRAIEFIGRNLEVATAEVIPRLKKLWEYRLLKAKQDSQKDLYKNEMVAFGYWFISDKIEIEWLLSQLESALEISGKVEFDRQVLEKLEKISDKYPSKILKCLELLIDGAENYWRISHWEEILKAILKVIIEYGDSDTKDNAIDLVHKLGSMGHLNFREVLKNIT